MRILIDADACPVVKITEKIAQIYGLKLFIFVDLYHNIHSDYGKVIRLDQRNQSVDMEIFNNCQENDLIVTQDYGLAALVLSKKARAIDQNGRVYTNENINHLLMKRHIYAKIRRAGGKHPTQSKRTKVNNLKFEDNLVKLIKLY